MLTKTQIEKVIEKVAQNHCHKKFDIHSENDIKQEVWIICLSKIKEFDFSRGQVDNEEESLERFLNTVVSNRLANFYRDKFVVPNREHLKKSQTLINKEIDIGILDNKCHKDVLHDLFVNEQMSHIKNKLTILELDILESLLNGETIPSYYKIKLITKIQKELSNVQDS